MTTPTRIEFFNALVASPLFLAECKRYFPNVGDGILYDAPAAVAKSLGCDDYHSIREHTQVIDSAIETVFKDLRGAKPRANRVSANRVSAKDKVAIEITKFHNLQNELANFGAADSEPRYHFEKIIEKAHSGEPIDPTKMNADWWELYTYSMKCEGAARRLTAQAKKVYNAILASKRV